MSAAPPTGARYRVLAWLCLAATIAYVHRNCISVAEGDVRADLCLSEQQMGWVISAFYVTYAAFQVPTGWLGHVWGTRKALPIFSVTWSLATALFGLAGVLAAFLATTVSVSAALLGGFLGLLVSRLLMGTAQAGIFPCTTGTTAVWFPATQRALASGSLGSFMSVGGAAGALLTGLLLEEIGWRWLFVLYAVPGILWAVGFARWFRNRPEQHAEVNPAELALIRGPLGPPADPAPVSHEPTPWGVILTSPLLGWICAQQFFRAAGYMFYASWFATYLRGVHHVSTREAGVLNSLPLWGVVAGSLVGGAASDWVLARTGSLRLSRQGVAVVSLLGCAGLIVLSHGISDVWLAVLVISAGSFCASLAAPCAYTITIDLGGRHVGPVFSVMNMAGNVGAIVFPLVVPWLLNVTESWDAVLFLFAGVYFAAAACWMLINPNGRIFA